MEIHDNVLPTYENVMRHYYFVRNTLRQEGANYEPASAEIALIVADKVLSIWNKASLPTLLHKSVVKRIIAYNNEIQKLKKHAQRMDETYLKKIEQFRMDSQRIFDICSCNCKCFSTCKCSSVKKKVPVKERDFLIDQRTNRKMRIGGLDVKTTSILNKRLARKSDRKCP